MAARIETPFAVTTMVLGGTVGISNQHIWVPTLGGLAVFLKERPGVKRLKDKARQNPEGAWRDLEDLHHSLCKQAFPKTATGPKEQPLPSKHLSSSWSYSSSNAPLIGTAFSRFKYKRLQRGDHCNSPSIPILSHPVSSLDVPNFSSSFWILPEKV